jgi:hypothetical protein
MTIQNNFYELTILDACIPGDEQVCLNAADIDGDGNGEIITGGNSNQAALVWYRPVTFEKGIIVKKGWFHVGMAIEDIDGDGIKEVVVGEQNPKGSGIWALVIYKAQKDLYLPWSRYIVDPAFEGGPHDIIFADVDGDGENELLSIACYTSTPGIYIFKKGENFTKPWKKHAVSVGIFTEGLNVSDLDGDGQLEIVCGPDWYKAPPAGPYSGLWHRKVYAPNFREMCRTACVDITGNGRPDIAITDSEFMDGYLSWFENRLLEDPKHPWIEHRLDEDLIYSHTLEVEKDEANHRLHLYMAEMSQGGWNAPYNTKARLIRYTTSDKGQNWEREVLHKGDGVCGAILYDIDNDGELEIIGKALGRYWHNPKVQIWDRRPTNPILSTFKHTLIDRDKPAVGVDILAMDVEGDDPACKDILCARFWYRYPDWQRYEIPGIVQVLNAYDIDRDGKEEIIAIKAPDEMKGTDYENLNSHLVWLKAIDPCNGKWEMYEIGCGQGDWPHATLIAPLLASQRLALITGYHSAFKKNDYPELFEVPDDPKTGPWPKRCFAEIQYGEEFSACDIDGDGVLDVVAGPYWLENLGTGEFKPYRFVEDEKVYAARIGIMDINKDGRPDVILGQEVMDFDKKVIPWSSVTWFENPPDPRVVPWKAHVIDTVRCAHSVGVGDLDNDGESEIVIGEHDPFWPYRQQCRTRIYKQADPLGISWKSYIIDSRFEHHDGTKIIQLTPQRKVILSHGWKDSIYVHIWELEELYGESTA